MRKSKPQAPGVKVNTSGKTSIASTMGAAVVGRKGRRAARKVGR